MKGRDVVLGLLYKNEQSGYEIRESIERRFSHFFDGTFGMIYPILKKLEKEELIQKKIVVQDGKPNKNIYSITTKGKEMFLKYLNSEIQEDIIKSDFLMHMYFAKYIDKKLVDQIIMQEIENTTEKLKQLEKDSILWDGKWDEYQKLCCDVGIAQYESRIHVLERFVKVDY